MRGKKLSDEKNALIRKGLGKAQSDQNYNQLYKTMTDQLKVLETTVNNNVNAPKPPPTELVATVKSETMDRFKPDEDGGRESKVEAKELALMFGLQSKKKTCNTQLKHFLQLFQLINLIIIQLAGIWERCLLQHLWSLTINILFNHDGFIEARRFTVF